jgi:glycerate kinase
VLVAPDSFKGTMSATEVAVAIGRGVEAAGWSVDLCPVADGGEGTLEVLLEAIGGERRSAEVRDPLGRPVHAAFALLGAGATAIVEVAEASGLGLVAAEERNAEAASSAGTGELIVAAIEAGAQTVIVAAGGSATTDGGLGAIEAISDGGGLRGARLVVLSDVRTPFERAAVVYGPQKGASSAAVERLTRRLHALAEGWPRDPRGMAMGGAAGGLAGGLWAALGAALEPGAPYVLDAVGFDARMRRARAVIAGEGRIDSQTLEGKAAGEILTRARQAGVPGYAIVGRDEIDRFDARILDLQEVVEAGTPEELEAAGRRLAERL